MTKALSTAFLISLVVALSVFSPPVQAKVYLNRIFNENTGTYAVGELYGEGVSWTFNRNYQNAYGSMAGLDPGPPFIIESGIRAVNTYDDDGNVEDKGTITFEAGFGLLSTAFDINFYPAEGDGAYISAASGVSFLGNSLDPITVQGLCDIESGGRGGADPWGTGQHSFTWSNTNFLGSFNASHPNSSPLKISGGHATIENCYFSMPDDRIAWALVFGDYVSYNSNDDPIWTLAMKNCRFQDYEPLNHLVTLMYLKSVSIEDCYFTDIEPRTVTDRTALVEIRQCGLKSVRNNTADNNTVSALVGIHCWTAGEARIKTNESLPLATSNIFIYEDSALAIEPGSVLKFFDYQSGLVAYGQLDIDSAVLTSYHDDEYGGDSDHTPQPSTIAAIWNVGNGCGIYVDTTGTATISNSLIRYADGGIVAHNDITIRNCILERFSDKGIALVGTGANLFRISNSMIQDITHHSGGANAAIFFENRSNHGQVVEIDSVTIRGNEMSGVSVGYLGDHPSRIEIKNSKVISNEGYGIRFSIYTSLTSMTVTNSMIVGNSNTGIYGIDYQSEGVPIRVTGNLIWGNGVAPYVNYDGINISSGVPTITNNTIGYNRGRGLYLIYSDDLDQASVANNIFYRNHKVGYYDANAEDPLFASNVFWENTDNPVTYRHTSGWLYTIAEIQALGGDFVSNIESDPAFVPEILGAAGFHRYNDSTKLSTIDVDVEAFSGIDVAGRFICPDTAAPRWFQISHMDGDSLLIFGDASEYTTLGHTYRIVDFHLADISPLVDAGRNTSVGSYHDIDGDNRFIDGDEDGTTNVDIGADEYNPEVSQNAIRVLEPTSEKLLMSFSTFNIEFQADNTIEQVDISYNTMYDPAKPDDFWETIATGVDATEGSYEWEIPPNETSTNCIVKVASTEQQDISAMSQPFKIKELTFSKLSNAGEFDKYSHPDDSWQFPNDLISMWPEAAWVDYMLGLDPVTGFRYPLEFADLAAAPPDFPSWPTFVDAFGVDACYIDYGPGKLYRPSAVIKWGAIKHKWIGSCFGLAITNLMAFEDSAAFAKRPEIGPFSVLHDLQITNERRSLINRYYTYQFGKRSIDHTKEGRTKTPNETLLELVDMYSVVAVSGSDRIITICDTSSVDNQGCHSVTPYYLDRTNQANNTWALIVYDNNLPDDYPTIEIDSDANSWTYVPLGWSGDKLLFLEDPLSNYSDPVQMKAVPVDQSAMLAAADHLEIYIKSADSVILKSEGGAIGKYGDSLFNELADGMPIIPRASGSGEPIGYYVPTANYDCELSGAADGQVRITAITDSTILSYGRLGASPMERHIVRIRDGYSVGVFNPDSTGRTSNIEFVLVQPDGERLLGVHNWFLVKDSGMVQVTPTGALSIANYGSESSYDIILRNLSEFGIQEFSHKEIPIGTNTEHLMEPDWDIVGQGLLGIVIDELIDGSPDDTIYVANDSPTDVEDDEADSKLPYQFKLLQNYPNPFNPVTTIDYTVPERSLVTIEIFNVLGQRIRTLVNSEVGAGSYTITWNGTDTFGQPVATGVFLYRFKAGDYVETRKMLLLK